MLAWIFDLTAWHSAVAACYTGCTSRVHLLCLPQNDHDPVCTCQSERTQTGSSMEHAVRCLDRINAVIGFPVDHFPDK